MNTTREDLPAADLAGIEHEARQREKMALWAAEIERERESDFHPASSSDSLPMFVLAVLGSLAFVAAVVALSVFFIN